MKSGGSGWPGWWLTARGFEGAMPELPDSFYERIVRLCRQGDALADQEEYAAALGQYRQAWSLLPEPRRQWEAATWIQAAIGDACFLAGDFAEGAKAFRTALNSLEAMGNPFLHLRLGQCLYELGHLHAAGDELARAFLLVGEGLFEQEDPKDLAFLKTVLEPPAGGWTR